MHFRQSNCIYHILNLFIKMTLQAIRAQINVLKSVAKANQAKQFFKTGPGQYGEGDIFVGLTNPQCRNIADSHKHINLDQLEELLQSKIHQERLIALVLMDLKYKNKKQDLKETLFKLYIRRMQHVNNWDLVDLSAPNIVGKYILQKCTEFKEIKDKSDPRNILYDWVKSPNLWFRRISIISTFTFIRSNHYYDTLQLSKLLLKDKEDLIHKAVGWMLRQVGKRQTAPLEEFILENYEEIPRTSLRYAIQRYEQTIRKNILKGKLECIIKK